LDTFILQESVSKAQMEKAGVEDALHRLNESSTSQIQDLNTEINRDIFKKQGSLVSYDPSIPKNSHCFYLTLSLTLQVTVVVTLNVTLTHSMLLSQKT
jgi:hypothetical protein